MAKKNIRKIHEKTLEGLDLTAEELVLDDLFFDLYRHRGRVYRMNFFRGVWFGLGTFLGGTVVVALVIVILTWLSKVLPDNVGFVTWLVDTLTKK